MPPLVLRAMRWIASSSAFVPLHNICLRRRTMSSVEIRRKSSAGSGSEWCRQAMRLVVQKMNLTCGGGSSKVFRKR